MRNAGLDILRLLAVLLVFCRHLLGAEQGNSVMHFLFTGGWVGVDLFFVLSGFLVSSLLYVEYNKCGSIDIKRFIIRRGFKIYPPLFVLIVVTVIVASLEGKAFKLRQTLSELLMMQNYAGSLWNHTWTLAVEWHFYLLLSFILYILVLKAKKRENSWDAIPFIFLLFAAGCLGVRILTAYLVPVVELHHYKWVYYGSLIRLDSLMFGVLIAYLWHFKNLKQRLSNIPTIMLLSIGVILFLPAFLYELEDYRFIPTFGYSLFYLAAGFFLLASIRLETTQNRLLAFLAKLGGASYSIYLWHMTLNRWVWPRLSKFLHLTLEQNYLVYFFTFVIGSILLGYWMNWLIEKPSLQLREFMFPRKNSLSITSKSKEAN